MKKNKIILLIGILIISYFMLMFLLTKDEFLADYKINNYSQLIIEYDTLWQWKGKNWENIKKTNALLDKKDFKVYINNSYKGQYKLKYNNDVWEYYNHDNKQEKFSGDLLAVNSTLPFEIAGTNIQKVNEKDIKVINQLLNPKGLSINNSSELLINEKVIFDFNQDGEDEAILNVSNMYTDDKLNSDLVYSLVLYIDNEKIMPIINNVTTKDKEYSNGYAYGISHIININNSPNYDIIIKRFRPLSNNYDCHIIYTWKDTGYEILKTCQEVNS